MKITLKLAAIALCLCSSAAIAEEGRYVSVAIGKTGGLDYQTSAGAFGTWYAGGTANAKLDSSSIKAIAIGSSIGSSPFRAELAISSHSHGGNLSSANFLATIPGDLAATSIPSKLSATSVDIIGYYDFPLLADFEPYLGLGGGVSKLKIVDHISTLDNSKYTPHGIAVAGLNYKLSDNTLGFAEVRQELISGAKIVITPEKTADFSNLGVTVGVRFYF